MLQDFKIPNTGPLDGTFSFKLENRRKKEPFFQTMNLQTAEQSDYRKHSVLINRRTRECELRNLIMNCIIQRAL